MALIECVPNFSEGRRPEVIAAIRQAIADVPGVRLLDLSADPWHNRTVITFAAPPDAVLQAAFEGIRVARDLIDLTAHEGVHPRMGAADVVPFVPLDGSTLEECIAVARELGDRVGRELHVPVFLYEHAALVPSRRNLADVRRGGFERRRSQIGGSPEHAPDCGPHRMHPTAGATAIGARLPLVAFNAYLGPATVLPAVRKIARMVRESSGGLPGVKALAFEVNGQAQLSMNLVDLKRTGVWAAFDAVEREAERHGLRVERTEIVGLVPERALWDAATSSIRLTRSVPDLVLEHRIRATAGSAELEPLLDRIAAPISAPGGGSVAAYAGALAAATAAMVGGIAARRGLGGESPSPASVEELRGTAVKLLRLADADADAYSRYVLARRSGADASAELLEAVRIPVAIARSAERIAAAAAHFAQHGLHAASADAATSALLAGAVCEAALLTVRVNLAELGDDPQGRSLLAEATAAAGDARRHVRSAVLAAAPPDA